MGIGLGQVLHGDGHVRERKAGSRIISDNITGTIVPWDISIHTSMGGSFWGGIPGMMCIVNSDSNRTWT